MAKWEKKTLAGSIVLSLFLLSMPSVSAMHIMEGFLPLGYCIMWGAICIPFVVMGLLKIKKIADNDAKAILMIAMAGAYTFVLSSLKIPSVTGSSSHPTGTGLGAILLGPTPMAVLGLIVLLFQAILLAHGGLTTLGANTFSMAIAGPFVSFGIFALCKKLKVNSLISVFLAATLGDLLTYIVTSFQLALAHPSTTGGVIASLGEFLGIFAMTQIPLAIIEGLITVVVVMGLETWAKPELRSIGYLERRKA